MLYTLAQLAEECGGRVVGNGATVVGGISSLTNSRPNTLTFITTARYRKYLSTCQAGAVLLRETDLAFYSGDSIVVDDPYLAYASLSALFRSVTEPKGIIHATAQIDPTATLGDGVSIGPYCVVGKGVSLGARVYLAAGVIVGDHCHIGADSYIYPQVTIYHGCKIGTDVTIHSGTVIGADGFGFANHNGSWIKIHQLGGVAIGNKVEIGANTTIDRGAIDDTIIGNGVIIDNLVQVAHNVQIGDDTAIAGCVGIAGSATIGAHCAIGGGAGILGHLEIVDRVVVTATSLVTKSIKVPGIYSSGTPLQPATEWQKNFARFKQLDTMARRLRTVEQTIQPTERTDP